MNLNKLSIQEILSLGYVYLLVLGIISDVIFYSFFDLKIVAYSSILDILLAPIGILTESWIIPAVTFLFVIVIYFFRVKMSPKIHAKNRLKESYLKKHDIKKLDLLYSKKPSFSEFIPVFALIIFFMFIGLRVGQGFKMKQRVKDKDLSYLDVINFLGDEKINATIIGQNSIYLFYVTEGDTKLSATPINQNIKVITKRTKNKTGKISDTKKTNSSKDSIK